MPRYSWRRPTGTKSSWRDSVNTATMSTMLCIAADITLPSEFIRSMKISEWKKNQPDLNGRLVVFVLQ